MFAVWREKSVSSLLQKVNVLQKANLLFKKTYPKKKQAIFIKIDEIEIFGFCSNPQDSTGHGKDSSRYVGTPVRPRLSFTNRLTQMVLLLSNSMHRPQTHLNLVPMELCKWGEDVLWNSSPIGVRPSNQPAPFKYSSTTPASFYWWHPPPKTPDTFTGLEQSRSWEALQHLRQEILQCSHQGHRCPVPGSLQQPKQRDLHTPKENQESAPKVPCSKKSAQAALRHCTLQPQWALNL